MVMRSMKKQMPRMMQRWWTNAKNNADMGARMKQEAASRCSSVSSSRRLGVSAARRLGNLGRIGEIWAVCGQMRHKCRCAVIKGNYRNRVRTARKSYRNRFAILLVSDRNRTETVQKPYRNRFAILLVSDRNHQQKPLLTVE